MRGGVRVAIDLLRKGGFNKEIDALALAYTSSLREDERIALADVQNSCAHAIMLCEQGILSRPDAAAILSALKKVEMQVREGTLSHDDGIEDIHPIIEARVIALAGEAGARLHTGRSRNDQVATDLRMNAREELLSMQESLAQLIDVLCAQALSHRHTIVPGFTHGQPAQTTTWAHYILSYAHSMLRHQERLSDAYHRVNICPLGAGPLAGSGLSLNRARTAELLGFDAVMENPQDAVSSRDYCIELQSVYSMICTDLSRTASDVLHLSALGLLSVDDAFAYTSSAMPQKRDPYVAEMIRARASRVSSNLHASLSILRGLPTGYNKDVQEIKKLYWEASDITAQSILVSAKMIAVVRVLENESREFCEKRKVTALDVAELLVSKGVPFRRAHEIVGSLSTRTRFTLGDLLQECKRVLGTSVDVSEDELHSALNVGESVRRRGIISEASVHAIRQQATVLASKREERVSKLSDARQALQRMVDEMTSAKAN